MGLASGQAGQLGAKAESTYGTAVCADSFFEFNSESLKYERERIESDGIRAGRRVLHRWAQGVQRVSGDIELELPQALLGIWLKQAFGGVSSSAGTPEVGANTHTFTLGDLAGKSLTVNIGRPDIGGVVRSFTYAGVKVTDLNIAAALNEYAKLTASVYAAKEDTAATLATASYASDYSPFVFSQGALTLAGSAYEISEFDLTLANNLAIDRHKISATNPHISREPLESGLREVTGSLSSDFIDLTAYNRFVNGTEAALVLTFTGGIIGATATNYKLTITMNVRFDGETPNVGGRELLEQALPFKAIHSTADASAITAVLINAEASY